MPTIGRLVIPDYYREWTFSVDRDMYYRQYTVSGEARFLQTDERLFLEQRINEELVDDEGAQEYLIEGLLARADSTLRDYLRQHPDARFRQAESSRRIPPVTLHDEFSEDRRTVSVNEGDWTTWVEQPYQGVVDQERAYQQEVARARESFQNAIPARLGAADEIARAAGTLTGRFPSQYMGVDLARGESETVVHVIDTTPPKKKHRLAGKTNPSDSPAALSVKPRVKKLRLKKE